MILIKGIRERFNEMKIPLKSMPKQIKDILLLSNTINASVSGGVPTLRLK